MTHLAFAFEVLGGWRQEKVAAIMKAMQTLMGGGASFSNGGPGKGMQSRLYLWVMIEYDSVQSVSGFGTVYDDTGLFGIHLATPSNFVAKAVDIAIKDWQQLQYWAKNLESRKNLMEDTGRQILINASGKSSQHFLKHIDEMTLSDVTLFVQRMLSSCPTMASWGDVDKVPTHEYVRKRIESPPSDLIWTLKSFFS